MSWKVHGTKGYEEHVNRAFANQAHLTKLIKENSDRFKLVQEPEGCNICFWYLPKAWRDKDFATIPKDDLDHIVQTMYYRMQKCGSMLFNHSPLSDRNLPRFFRLIFVHPQVTDADVKFIIEECDRLGEDLTPQDLV